MTGGGHIGVHPPGNYLGDGGEGGVRGEGWREGHHTPHQLELYRHECRN